ncbi:oxidoreductase [Halioglobus japonicus]|uniref:3-sulfinopropanoyl-CoA desulfinase n=2 Tax=Halioglobus japonicus TaxID=930805 RepID=A0AAP8SNX7_9GAMM|nr:oxidoreductase [Halioglobus japonicus]PLW86941.1 oxidoreductase [Halioglobus japonicus]
MSKAQQAPMFDLTLSEEQLMFRDTLQRLADNDMRALAKSADVSGESPVGFYAQAAELGLTMLPIPEALGGSGMGRSPVSNALIMEDLARGDMSLALGAVMPQAFVNTLLDQGSDAQREQYLPKFCEGVFVPATTALLEPRATFDPEQLACTARRTESGYVLNGKKCMVPLGLDAELLLVIASVEGEGAAAFIVEGTPEGMTRAAETHMGLRSLRLASLEFTDVTLPAESILGAGEFDLQRFVDLSRIGICALAVGVGQSVLDYTKVYVNEREAFGEPISNRQSVAFKVADMAIELEAMRLMTWRAASLAEQGKAFHEQAYLAKVACGRYAMQIGTDGVQLLGGHGYCREHPVEMWYRNMRSIALLDGVASV